MRNNIPKLFLQSKWKFDNQFDGSMTKVTVKFNGANYTHFVSLGDGVSPEEPETTPKNLFLTGEASEGGNDISKAMQYNKWEKAYLKYSPGCKEERLIRWLLLKKQMQSSSI